VKFIVENGYDIKKGQAVEFQKWLADNEKEIAATAPDGFEYLGTFSSIFSSTPEVGAVRTLWALDSYGAMDTFADSIKAGGTFARLMDTMAGFALDQQDGGHVSNALSRNVTDTAIWGDNA
jgi:hypothetical protein